MGDLLAPDRMLVTFGAFGIFAVLFAETGLLVGFFLPGDTLLIAAGVLAATPATAAAHLPLGAVLVAAAAGALLGAQVGYLIGHKAGPRLFATSEGSRVAAGMRRSRELLERFGHARAIVLARFVPVARTLMNPLAGASGVPVRRFLLWQSVGGLTWSVGIVLLGYFLGSSVPDVESYLLPAFALITVAAVLPVLVRALHQRREAEQLPVQPPVQRGPSRGDRAVARLPRQDDPHELGQRSATPAVPATGGTADARSSCGEPPDDVVARTGGTQGT